MQILLIFIKVDRPNISLHFFYFFSLGELMFSIKNYCEGMMVFKEKNILVFKEMLEPIASGFNTDSFTIRLNP